MRGDCIACDALLLCSLADIYGSAMHEFLRVVHYTRSVTTIAYSMPRF